MSPETNYAVVKPSVKPRISLKPIGAPPAPHTHAKLDRLGIWLSTICAVHCMVLPVVLIFFPVMTWIRWSHLTDVIVISVAAVIGVGGCLLSLRHHRDARPLCLVLAGLMINSIGRFAGLHLGPLVAQTMVVGGPMLMAYGMWKDRRLCAHNCSAH